MLIFPNGGIPAASGGGGRGGRGGGAAGGRHRSRPNIATQIGRVTADRTIPQLRAFVEAGGTVVAIGDAAANLAAHFKLPLEDHLVEKGAPLPRAKYFVPGSVLTARVDVTHPLAAGMRERTDFFFDNSPVFKLRPERGRVGVRVIAAFDIAGAASQRLGVGSEISRRRRDRRRRRRRQGAGGALRTGDPAARAAARDVQAALQRDLRRVGSVTSGLRARRPLETREQAQAR